MIEVDRVVEWLSLHVAQEQRLGGPGAPTLIWAVSLGPGHCTSQRERIVGGVVVVYAQAELLQVIGALGPTGCLACRLHGGQQEGNQDGDDRDHDEQLDQCEATACFGSHGTSPSVSLWVYQQEAAKRASHSRMTDNSRGGMTRMPNGGSERAMIEYTSISHAAGATDTTPFLFPGPDLPRMAGDRSPPHYWGPLPCIPPLAAAFFAAWNSFIDFFMSSFIMFPNVFRSSGVMFDGPSPPEQPSTPPTRPSIRSGTIARTNRTS